MSPSKVETVHSQKLVDDLFDTQASYWMDTYKDRDIQGVIYQQRQTVALSYIDGLSLAKSARILEIGCGAGYLTVALAKRGFAVEAIDHSKSMVDLTVEHAKRSGIRNLINVHKGDVHELPYEDESFDLIIAIGVIPWLHNFEKAMSEIIRILASGGNVVLTMDNALRATTLLDPLTSPPIAQARRWIKRKLENVGLLTSVDLWKNAPPYSQHTPKEFKRSLLRAGLTVLKSTSVGFGPFTFFGHSMFPEMVSIKIQEKLFSYVDCGYPFLRSTGSQYIVLATRKCGNHPLTTSLKL